MGGGGGSYVLSGGGRYVLQLDVTANEEWSSSDINMEGFAGEDADLM